MGRSPGRSPLHYLSYLFPARHHWRIAACQAGAQAAPRLAARDTFPRAWPCARAASRATKFSPSRSSRKMAVPVYNLDAA